ncbi:hypothetical protein NDN08_007742 [Rhodosorus marinus]|uniref:RNA helicase n=1 Tax=Rhodosorus marinus TaxID=101924 RepID=A0AAV8V372_9RHOD|nr:hypothetical protein NDN08_007742 [Rhodosorus marinus]
MASEDVEMWVRDELYDLVGLSDKNLAQFLVAMAKNEQSADSVERQLVAVGGFKEGSLSVKKFANELFGRVGSVGDQKGAVSVQGRKEKTQVEDMRRKQRLLDKNRTYDLVDMQEEVPETSLLTAEKSDTRSSSRKRRKLRSKKEKRKDSESSEDDAEQVRQKIIESERRDREKCSADEREDSGIDSEEERRRDLKERDEFADRLKERDESNRKRQDPEKSAALRSIEDMLNDDKELKSLRDISRREYLKKREEKKLQLLKEEIEDEEYLFEGVKVTEEERKELELKKETYRLAQERAKLIGDDSDEEGGRYRMPDAFEDMKGVSDEKKRLQVLTKRYKEDPSAAAGKLKTDQQEWEDHLINKAITSKTPKAAPPGEKSYDLLLDDFRKEDLLAGYDNREAESEDELEIEAKSIAEERRKLPVFPYREELIKAVHEYQVLVVVGETGSGKTTQIPQYLIEEGFGGVCCTQPRRVAAMSVAARVATEVGCKLGSKVGYSIRFEDCTSDKTVIKYMTDGMLLREFLSEPDLGQYHVIIIDEAHERSLSTDIAMGLVKDIARARGDSIRIIISSATLNAEKFRDYFDDAPIFNIPGRRYPVDIYYTKAPEADYLDACCVSVLQIHASQPPGDILVFLTGQEEIETAVEILNQRTRGLGSKVQELMIAPIYSTLPADMQAKIFEPTPPGARKVVLATNIAETSVTIPGIVYVIDPGFCKQKSYNPKTGMESLIVVPVSRAGAVQRTGRAGRTQPGKCFRMFTKWSFYNEMEEDTIPEILRTNLAQVVLLLKSLGIDDLINFDFIDAPPSEVLIKSLEQLYALGALNDRGELTKLGRRMAELPLDPMMAKSLIGSEKYSCSEEVATICAMLSVNNSIFYRPKDKGVIADAARAAFARGGGGDHMALLNCYNQWRDSGFSTQWCYENFVQARSIKQARDVRDQLDGLMDRVEVEKTSNLDGDAICKAIASGFFYNATRLEKGGTYRTLKNPHTVHIHPSSCLFKSEKLPRWLIYHELVFTTKEFMRQVIQIESAWLLEIAPFYYQSKELEDQTKAKLPKVVGKASTTT